MSSRQIALALQGGGSHGAYTWGVLDRLLEDKLGHGGIAAASAVPVPDATARAYLFLTRFFSPYQLNPLNINPLRDIVSEQVDFERLRAECRMKLFISTTRVSNGALRIFSREELTIDALLASACIPSIHRSVEVDGVAHWDGGLTANPPLSVLVYKCSASDLLVVVLNPMGNDDVPSTADAIAERLS